MESSSLAELKLNKDIISSCTSTNSFRLQSPSLNKVRLRRIFDMFDKNKDSIISSDELGQALSLLGLQTDQSEMKSMVLTYSQSGNSDGLTYDDFMDLHRYLNDVYFHSDEAPSALEDQTESDLSEAFKVFDEDGDGYISARELQVVLGKLGLQEEGRELDRVEMMISSVDRNQDGRVDFFEFKDMMHSVMVPN